MGEAGESDACLHTIVSFIFVLITVKGSCA